MNKVMKRVILAGSPILDVLAAPLVLTGALLFKLIRKYGVARLGLSRRIFQKVGVIPVTDHYYEPFFRREDLTRPLFEDRALPGIDMNVKVQLELMEKFDFNEELDRIPRQKGADLQYYYDNEAFLSGDAEFLYNMIRHFKPARIVEVGSGFSTLMAIKAIQANRHEDGNYHCGMICIEPFEHSWLEKLEVTVHRERVQNIDPDLFGSLDTNDILFIDTSHITKPQNDVLFLYLEILPTLKPGVLVHIHDIFTPRDYPDQWIFEDVRFWNEQYLLEAFLSHNSRFEVLAGLNFLLHHHSERLLSVCPVLAEQVSEREPGSFWIRRTG